MSAKFVEDIEERRVFSVEQKIDQVINHDYIPKGEWEFVWEWLIGIQENLENGAPKLYCLNIIFESLHFDIS